VNAATQRGGGGDLSSRRAASAVSDGTARRGAAVECQLLQPARRSE